MLEHIHACHEAFFHMAKTSTVIT